MGLFQDQELFDRLVSVSISRELSEQLNSLLRLISALDIQLKNKLLGKLKLAAFSLIFFLVAQMRSSFGQEEKLTVFHPLQSSEWWATNLWSWNGDFLPQKFFFGSIQSHEFDKVPESAYGRGGLCLIINVEFRPPPPLRHIIDNLD